MGLSAAQRQRDYRERQRAIKLIVTIACAACGKEFTKIRPWQRFCDDRCSLKSRVEDGRSAAAQKKFRERNPDRARQINRDSARKRNATPEGKRYRKELYLKRYGITVEIFEAIAQRQNGLCATCLCTLDMSFNTHVDHDHKTGVVRGLLCSPCNRSIGGFKDDPATLRRAADYLEGKGKLCQ